VSAKTTAWKDALGFFIAMVVVSFGWNLVARTKESLGHIFGVALIAALFMYVMKRTDLFD
jgi:hypothetical protein